MPGLTPESKVFLNETMELISIGGMTAEEKIKKIKMWLDVNVVDIEVELNYDRLKEIIETRMPRPCPQCNGEFDINKRCCLCDDKGEIDGVAEEKYLLNNPATTQT